MSDRGPRAEAPDAPDNPTEGLDLAGNAWSAVPDAGARPAPRAAAPLGPDSLLWRYAGDWRSILPGSATGLLQLMFPPLGAAVAAQSGFFENPYARIWRSIPQIWATILAPDGAQRARHVRDLHRHIKGSTESGRRYHALDPETFWWAHATFTWNIFRSIELFHPSGTLSSADRERLYAETVSWYDLYGMSQRPVPADYAAFQAKFDAFCAERLELTPAVRQGLRVGLKGQPRPTGPQHAGLTRSWLKATARLRAFGPLPPQVRERFELNWSAADQRRFERVAAAARVTFRLTPPAVNRGTFTGTLRLVGARTRAQRYRPTSLEAS